MKDRKSIDSKKTINPKKLGYVSPDAQKTELWDYEFGKSLYNLVGLLEEVTLSDD